MDIEKMISNLRNMEDAKIKTLRANSEKRLKVSPRDADAEKLHSAIKAELSRRKLAQRIYVPPLWWEPHDPDVAAFHAYEAADALTPVATIFKSATHTSTRKAVYSVRIGDLELPTRFEKVDKARQAGSEAWVQRLVA